MYTGLGLDWPVPTITRTIYIPKHFSKKEAKE